MVTMVEELVIWGERNKVRKQMHKNNQKSLFKGFLFTDFILISPLGYGSPGYFFGSEGSVVL